MKKLLAVVFTMLLAASLTFAQKTDGRQISGGPSTPLDKTSGGKEASQTKEHKGGKKGHKGGKKSKKGQGDTTSQAPK